MSSTNLQSPTSRAGVYLKAALDNLSSISDLKLQKLENLRINDVIISTENGGAKSSGIHIASITPSPLTSWADIDAFRKLGTVERYLKVGDDISETYKGQNIVFRVVNITPIGIDVIPTIPLEYGIMHDAIMGADYGIMQNTVPSNTIFAALYENIPYYAVQVPEGQTIAAGSRVYLLEWSLSDSYKFGWYVDGELKTDWIIIQSEDVVTYDYSANIIGDQPMEEFGGMNISLTDFGHDFSQFSSQARLPSALDIGAGYNYPYIESASLKYFDHVTVGEDQYDPTTWVNESLGMFYDAWLIDSRDEEFSPVCIGEYTSYDAYKWEIHGFQPIFTIGGN